MGTFDIYSDDAVGAGLNNVSSNYDADGRLTRPRSISRIPAINTVNWDAGADAGPRCPCSAP